MSQIRYEIIEALTKPMHTRAIARTINTPLMTTQRELKTMTKENILYTTIQGKNTLYQLKTTIQARMAKIQMETNKLAIFEHNNPKLHHLIKELIKLDLPLILIFGSYAKGTQKSSSDIDIYAKTNNKRIIREIENLQFNIHLQTGKWNNTPLFKEMQKHHVIIKGFEHYQDLAEPPLGSKLLGEGI